MDPDIDEDMWVLRRVFTVKELKNKNSIICNCFGDGKCDLVACSEWRSKDDYCYSCIDCQEQWVLLPYVLYSPAILFLLIINYVYILILIPFHSDYDGWPEPESGELPAVTRTGALVGTFGILGLNCSEHFSRMSWRCSLVINSNGSSPDSGSGHPS